MVAQSVDSWILWGSTIIIRSAFYITGGAKSETLIFSQACRERLTKQMYWVVLLHIFWVGRCTGDPIMARVGYRNPVPIWHRYLCYRYVLEPNQNADFGAMPEWSVEIFVLCFFETDVRSIITVCKKLFPDWKMHVNSIRKVLIIQVQHIFVVTRVCCFHIPT